MTQHAPLRLAQLFTDHAVLQQRRPVPVWGWARPGAKVSVAFAGQTLAARAGRDGRWQAALKPMPACADGRDLVVECEGERVTVHDVLVGEVWLCSGQSNVVFNVKTAAGGLDEAAKADALTAIRCLTINVSFADAPLADLAFPDTWTVCDSGTAPHISAVGFFFARRLHQDLGVPVGIIVSAMGGSRIEAWMPPEDLARLPAGRRLMELAARAGLSDADGDFFALRHDWQKPCRLHHTMIAPLTPAALAGVLWYQGESNTFTPAVHPTLGARVSVGDYKALLKILIASWRRGFARKRLPFVLVQLPNYRGDNDDTWAALRDAQSACAGPSVSLAVTIDVGNPTDGHPLEKIPVGERSALQALAHVYARAGLASGPTLRSLRVRGRRAVLTFAHTGAGLTVPPAAFPLVGFTIAGRDRTFHPADAVVGKTTVTVSSPHVPHPLAVRYAWANDPVAPLANSAHLPASPFRTDRWPLRFPPARPAAHAVVLPLQIIEQASLPLVDLDDRSDLQVVVDRQKGQYLGHPTTVLLDDGRTMLAVYPKGHGRGPIVMKRSRDGGLTWSARLKTPASWATSLEIPTIFPVVDPAGVKRLILFSGLYPIRMAVSQDDGAHWSELKPIGDFGGICAMTDCLRLSDGSYLVTFHDDGRFIRGGGKCGKTFRLYTCTSRDGGLSWSRPRTLIARSDVHLCEGCFIRSPDGRQIAMLMRENSRRRNAMVVFSDDEGRTWSPPREMPAALNGDRHQALYAPDGRLFVTFRRTVVWGRPTPRCEGDWMAWVGTYDDIAAGREGQYLVRLKDNKHSWDCAYSAVELLPDGTIVATTYGHWTEGEPPYILSVRLTLAMLDQLAGGK